MIPAQFDYLAPTIGRGGAGRAGRARRRRQGHRRRAEPAAGAADAAQRPEMVDRPRPDRRAARHPRRRRRHRHRRDDHAPRRRSTTRWSRSTRCCSPRPTRELADPQIRHRGTFGGALAHADPAGDLGAPALALGAEFVIAGPGGTRTVAADDFFVDLFETAIGEGELLTEIRIPKHTGWGAHYEKFVRVAHQWSIVAVAATVKVDGGTITEARVGLTNMGSTPLRASAVEEALVGQPRDRGRRTRGGGAAPPRAPTRPPTSTATPTTGATWPGAHPPGRARGRGGVSRMELNHSSPCPTGVEETWAHFEDIASVAECFPGATVTSVEGDTFAGTVKVKLGPIALVYTGTGTFVEKDEAAHAVRGRRQGQGQARQRHRRRRRSRVAMTGRRRLDRRATCITDLAITGKPAQFGRGVMQDVSDKLLGQFVACLEARLTGPAEPAPVDVPRWCRQQPLRIRGRLQPHRPGGRRRHRVSPRRSTWAVRCCRSWRRPTGNRPWARSRCSSSSGGS